MTDQDHDGSHIKGLFINFVHRFWPELLSDGFLSAFVTPLVKAKPRSAPKRARKRGDSDSASGGDSGAGGAIEFYTAADFEAWKRAQVEAGSLDAWVIKYYKGLGTSTAAEARTYFSRLDRHLVALSRDDAEPTDDLIDMIFAKARSAERKVWLGAGDWADDDEAGPGTGTGTGTGAGTGDGPQVSAGTRAAGAAPATDITYGQFFNEEFIEFSRADNVRNIPSVIDGLKPGQRKILFAAFKRRLSESEMKVAQLAGYVAEVAEYHHGEASLVSTIVGMAQDYVGANNANLFQPLGQFGTRLQGGKDAASARYIYTQLDPLARALFPEADDATLRYTEGDNLATIEPAWYAPVIPMALVNGAEGIGTGWSTSVPSFNPIDLAAILRSELEARLEAAGGGGGEELPPWTLSKAGRKACRELVPWVRGFGGQIVKVAPGKYESRGVLVAVAADQPGDDQDDAVYEVRELPVGTWTQSYKEWLEKSIADDKAANAVASYVENNTEQRVLFRITLKDSETAPTNSQLARSAPKTKPAKALWKRLRLTANHSTTNMHLFDADGRLRRYDVDGVLDDWGAVRLSAYANRKARLLSDLASEIGSLAAREAFTDLVLSGTVALGTASTADLIAALREAGVAERPSDRTPYASLLSLPVSSLTKDARDRLSARRAQREAEADALAATRVERLWLNDLDVFESAWRQSQGET